MTLGGSGARWQQLRMSWTAGCRPHPSTRSAMATLKPRCATLEMRWLCFMTAWLQQWEQGCSQQQSAAAPLVTCAEHAV